MSCNEVHSSRVSAFRAIQKEIAACQACCRQWPDDVTRPVGSEDISDEIPDPPHEIDILFVGVAPTAQNERNHGNHFYSSRSDNLRRGLFRMLNEDFKICLEGMSLDEGNRRFHESKFFFVHAAKVRPLVKRAPPPEAISFCAREHLRAEIPVLNPNAVCFLGLTNAAFGAEAVFEQRIGKIPIKGVIPGWKGKVAVAPQPVPFNRRIREGTASVLRLLLGNTVSS